MSASNDFDEAMIARWETAAHGIYTGENATEFARLIALARRATAAEARVEELEAALKPFADKCESCGHHLPRYDKQVGIRYDYRLLMNDLRTAHKLLENKP